MESFSDFTKEKYDKLKIFLITNFNLTFQPSSDSDVVETFEIVVKQGKIGGHYHKNSSLELIPSENTEEECNKIVDKIKELSNQEQNSICCLLHLAEQQQRNLLIRVSLEKRQPTKDMDKPFS